MAGAGRPAARAAALRCSARLTGERDADADQGAASAAARVAAARAAAAVAAAERRARAAERELEVEDSPKVLRDKCRRLARALRDAKHLVVYTGAGISTAADIPDYRGPCGVWTALRRGQAPRRVEVSRAAPTYTHLALTALWARGLLKFVVSQNCDGLHVRAGLPRRALAELHGNCFAERCAACRRVYLRAFDTTERTARHAHRTGRLCHACGAQLQDTIVHFGERGRAAWPLNWAGALRHAAAADVVLCLGSSLKVLRRYPRLWRMQRAPHRRPRLYIVNLQWTPKDAAAALKINARCDAVMSQLARRLHLRVPRYTPRRDPLLAHAVPLAPPERHTTRRPALPSPPPSSASSSADSDDELPLRRLAERLRPPPDLLHAFQVRLHSGEAGILLRAQHAPSAPRTAASPAARPLSDLRLFRIARRPHPSPSSAIPRLNGHAHDGEMLGEGNVKEEGVTVKQEGVAVKQEGVAVKQEGVAMKKDPDSGSECDAKATARRRWRVECEAAAIIARAVLLCRASLYPGLHTIIAPPEPPAPPAADCVWCWRYYGARRCLWYGAPPAPEATLESRAWRRAGRRRYLCACCDGEPAPPPAHPAPPLELDDSGWFGKGYRKGRRRRR